MVCTWRQTGRPEGFGMDRSLNVIMLYSQHFFSYVDFMSIYFACIHHFNVMLFLFLVWKEKCITLSIKTLNAMEKHHYCCFLLILYYNNNTHIIFIFIHHVCHHLFGVTSDTLQNAGGNIL